MGLFRKKKKVPYWIQKTHLFRKDEFICSACGCKAKKAYRYCPACGSYMIKVRYDASWVDEAEFMDMMWD